MTKTMLSVKELTAHRDALKELRDSVFRKKTPDWGLANEICRKRELKLAYILHIYIWQDKAWVQTAPDFTRAIRKLNAQIKKESPCAS